MMNADAYWLSPLALYALRCCKRSRHKLAGFHHSHNLVAFSQHLDPPKGVSF